MRLWTVSLWRWLSGRQIDFLFKTRPFKPVSVRTGGQRMRRKRRGVYGYICTSCDHSSSRHTWNDETPWEEAVFICRECGCEQTRESPDVPLGRHEWCEKFGHAEPWASGRCSRCEIDLNLERETLCLHCEQPIAWWGVYGEWRHIGGGRECFRTFAVPGKRAPRWNTLLEAGSWGLDGGSLRE